MTVSSALRMALSWHWAFVFGLRLCGELQRIRLGADFMLPIGKTTAFTPRPYENVLVGRRRRASAVRRAVSLPVLCISPGPRTPAVGVALQAQDLLPS